MTPWQRYKADVVPKIVAALILTAFLYFTDGRFDNTVRFIRFIILFVIVSAGSILIHRYAAKASEQDGN